ncbi:MAG: sugar phosphate isomerase/epimerase family protein [Limimaricola soesokkakensis]|uniref:sugar phosphate isomerase/epimerase family protein n=1 Tax=Limimaricola soesokkakensis TaxID=1343159 RepID=UPI004058A323
MLLSLQLYSARNYTPYTDVIAKLGALGYDAAEGYFANFEEARATRAALDAAGLKMPSIHVPIEMCEADPDGVAELAGVFGATRIFAPYLTPEERPAEAQGWRDLAARLAKCHEAMETRGLAFGWHNHDFEITPLADGSVPMEILLTEAPKIDWEADIAWIVRGGGDPLDWIARHGQRITAAHFKDIAPEGEKADEDGWADAGTGTLDWPAILAALKAQSACEILVAEHDNPNDFDRFARTARDSFAKL